MTVDELLIDIKAKNDQAKKVLKDTRRVALDTAGKIDSALNNVGKNAGSAASKSVNQTLKKTRELKDELKILNQKARLDAGVVKPSKKYIELQAQIRATTRELDSLNRRQASMSPVTSKHTDHYAELKREYDETGKAFEALLDKEEEMKGFDISNSGLKMVWDDLQDEIARTAAKLGELETMMADMEASGEAYVPNEKWHQLQAEITGATDRLNEYKAAERDMLKTGAAVDINSGSPSFFSKMGAAISSVSKKFPTLGKSAKVAKGGIESLLSGFKGIWNIAKLFIVGQGLMGFVNATKEGFNNLAGYSASTRSSLESLKSSLATLKNAFATAFAPILDIVAPILSRVIDWCTAAATAIAHLFSALTGRSTTVVARKATSGISGVGSAASDAAGAVDDLNRSLMGFDEINKLDDNNSNGSGGGGGGGGGADAGGMFETVEVSPQMSALADAIREAWENADFTELGNTLAEKLNSALESIPWDKIKATAKKIASSIATFLNGFFGNDELWTTVGHTFAEALNTVFEFGYTFATTFKWDTLGTAISNAINGFVDRLDLKKAAEGISAFVTGIFTTIKTAIEGIEWEEVGQKIGEFIVNIDWIGIVKSIGEALVAAIRAAFTVFDEVGMAILQAIQDAINEKFGLHIDLVGNVKEVDQKNLDPKQKILNGMTGELTGKTTGDGFNSTIGGMTAKFTKKKDSIPKKSKTIGKMKAEFTKRSLNKKFDSSIYGMNASFSSRTDNLSSYQKKLYNFTAVIEKVANGISSGVSAGLRIAISVLNAEGGIFKGGKWSPIQRYASGGLPNGSQLFWAREAGPELVGTLGGHTAVMNNDQIVASVSAGVYKAVLSAMSQGSYDRGTTVVLEGDAAKIFRVVQSQAKNYTNATGLSPFPV